MRFQSTHARFLGRRRSIVAAAVAIGGAATLASAVQAAPRWSPNVERWGVEEIVLSSAQTYSNPFADVRMAATFRCGGQTVKADGFFDGGAVWKVRFMPDRTGPCSFRTVSTDAALNDVSGRFMVRAAAPANHGPVHVARTYHFDYADGTPYFLLGTTSYNWLNRSNALQDETLASLGKTGFTKLRFGLFPKWYQFNRVEPAIFPYVRKPDGSFDLDRFDPRFFTNVEKRLRQLSAMGVEADVILFHPYDHWGFAKMDEAHNEAWLRYVTARLSAYRNVWWTMANEYDLMTPRDWNRLGQVVKSNDPYGHPIGIHNAGVWWDPNQPWLDHVIIQDGSPNAGRSASIARKRYAKPIVVDEYGYEGNNTDGWGELSGREELARHWDITMAGGYASHGETYVHPNGVLFWAAGGELVGESPARLAFLRSVMTSLPFQEMTPASDLVTNGTALALPGKAYLFYFGWDASQLTASRQQVRLAGADLFKVELIDPWQMKTYLLGYTAPGDQAFTLPLAPALLRITAADKGAGAPRPIGELATAISGDLSSAATADPARFKPTVLHYAMDFQLAQVEASPAAYALLQQYLPDTTLKGFARAFPLSLVVKIRHLTPEQQQTLADQLSKIPVQ